MDDSSLGYVGTQDDVLVPRAAAFVIDHLVSITLGAFLGLQLGMALDWVLWVYVGVIGGTLGYFVVLEWLFGKTIGKRLVGVVVVSDDGRRISVRQAVVRNVLRLIDGLFAYGLALLVMFTSREVKRVGDHAADTLVVRARR